MKTHTIIKHSEPAKKLLESFDSKSHDNNLIKNFNNTDKARLILNNLEKNTIKIDKISNKF